MRTSCIAYPESYYTLTRQCCIDIAENDLCAAKLINFFVSWHDYKKANQPKVLRENKIVQQHGGTELQDTSLLQHHTTDELIEGLIGEYARRNIANALQILDKKGFVTIHKNPNPKYKGDRTKHFLVHPEIIQKALDLWSQCTKSANNPKNDIADFAHEVENDIAESAHEIQTPDHKAKIPDVDIAEFGGSNRNHKAEMPVRPSGISCNVDKIPSSVFCTLLDHKAFLPDHKAFLPDHKAKMPNHYQYPFQYSFQNTNTPLPPQGEKFGGVFSELENSDRMQPTSTCLESEPLKRKSVDNQLESEPLAEGSTSDLLIGTPSEHSSMLDQDEPAREEITPPSLKEIRNPETRPPSPPRSTKEVATIRTTGKKLDLYGPDRKDAPAVNWGIDNGLWQTKQELINFRIAFIAYIPLVAKLSWINEPITYVRSTVRKAIEGEDAEKATVIELWGKYTPSEGIELPKAPWLSLNEPDRQWYQHWIETDTRWNWQREAIDNWADKALNSIDSKPCKDAWEVWLFDRQADVERLAQWAKQKKEQAEAKRISDAIVPMTPEEIANASIRIQGLRDRLATKEANDKAERIARTRRADIILGLAQEGDENEEQMRRLFASLK
jgi:hypothetical protein